MMATSAPKKREEDPAKTAARVQAQKNPLAKTLSPRGQDAMVPALTYLKEVIAAVQDLYDPETNPEGWVVGATAENKLMYTEFMLPKLCEAHAKLSDPKEQAKFSPYYGDMRGMPIVREAVAKLMEMLVVKKKKIDPNGIVLTPGVTSAVSFIAYMLASPNDACILPAPYYPAFDNDLYARAKVVPVEAFMEKVPIENQPSDVMGMPVAWRITEACMEKAYTDAKAMGHEPKIFLLTNPENPLGISHTEEELKLVVDFVRKHNMHLVSDEIYAGDCHSVREGDISHISILDVASGPDIHVLYGMSKDFGLSGHRMGFIYSENDALISAMSNHNMFQCVSGLAQAVLYEMISDLDFVRTYTEESNRRLRKACDAVQTKLTSMGIPFYRPTATLFFMMDLRKYLASPTWEAERALFDLFAQHKILLTPGRDCHFPEPGYFRMCFAAASEQAMSLLLDRLATALKQ